MAKFYVQAGSFSRIILAEDAQGAALATVHTVLGDPIEDDRVMDPVQWVCESEVDEFAEDVAELILVSEIGFGRSEAGCFATEDIIQHWHDLMVAIENMLKIGDV
jgi:hypothetical protein